MLKKYSGILKKQEKEISSLRDEVMDLNIIVAGLLKDKATDKKQTAPKEETVEKLTELSKICISIIDVFILLSPELRGKLKPIFLWYDMKDRLKECGIEDDSAFEFLKKFKKAVFRI